MLVHHLLENVSVPVQSLPNLVCNWKCSARKAGKSFEDLAVSIERINYTEIEENTNYQENRDYFQSNCSTGHTLAT